MSSGTKFERLNLVLVAAADATNTIDASVASPCATNAMLGATSDPAINKIATSVRVVMSSYAKFEHPDHVTAADGIKMADTHGSAYDTTALSAIITPMPVLAHMIGGAINSAVVNLVRPSQHAAIDDPVTMLLMIGLSTAGLDTIIRIVDSAKKMAIGVIKVV